MYFVYIIRCNDNTLYTGITRNLRKRLKEHNFGQVPFTKNRKPLRLSYWKSFKTRREAAKIEREIKGWRKTRKKFS